MSIKKTFEIDELSRVVKFVHALEALSVQHNIRLDSLDGTYLVIGGRDSCFFVHTDDNEPYVVSALVSV